MLRSDAEHRVSKHPPARAARSRAGLERPSTGSGRGQRKTLAVWTEKGAYPFEKSTRRPKPRARGPKTGSMTVAIIDYGSGNLHSAAKAFERAAREAGLACEVKVTSCPEDVLAAERVVLPGVGAFADCRRGLDAVPGMAAALIEAVRKRGAPFLGICVGAQLMATRGLEYEAVAGLDWIKGDVAPIKPRDATLKIPHMGWNTLDVLRGHPVLNGVKPGADGLHAYFVHSYQLYPTDGQDIVATADYAGPITAIVARDNMVGTQFHPEKSQKLGLMLIANFLMWRP